MRVFVETSLKIPINTHVFRFIGSLVIGLLVLAKPKAIGYLKYAKTILSMSQPKSTTLVVAGFLNRVPSIAAESG